MIKGIKFLHLSLFVIYLQLTNSSLPAFWNKFELSIDNFNLYYVFFKTFIKENNFQKRVGLLIIVEFSFVWLVITMVGLL